MHHCDRWRIKDQLDVTCYFISLLMCSTCWAHKKWNKIASDIKLVFYSSSNVTTLRLLISSRKPNYINSKQEMWEAMTCRSSICFRIYLPTLKNFHSFSRPPTPHSRYQNIFQVFTPTKRCCTQVLLYPWPTHAPVSGQMSQRKEIYCSDHRKRI